MFYNTTMEREMGSSKRLKSLYFIEKEGKINGKAHQNRGNDEAFF